MNILEKTAKLFSNHKFLVYMLFAFLSARVSIDYIGLFMNLEVSILGELSLSRLFVLITIPFTLLFLFLYRKKILETPLTVMFFLIIFIDLITIPFTPLSDTKEVLIDSLRILSIVFIYVLSYVGITSYTLFRKLIYVIIASSFVSLILAIFQFIKGVGYTDVAFSELRIFGAFTHPNVYGTYLLAIISAVLIGISIARTTKERIILIIILIVEFFALTMTFTRIAWIMGLFIIGAFVIVKNRILALPLFAMVIFSYVALPEIKDRVNEALTLSPDSSLIWRFNLWHDTIFYTISNNSTWLGNGTGSFMDFANEIRGDLFGDLEPHNEYVRSFVENGLIGLSVFMLYIISFTVILISRITKLKNKLDKNVFFVLSLLFIALSFASLSDHILRSTPLQWVLMAMLGGAFSISKKSSKEIEKLFANKPEITHQ